MLKTNIVGSMIICLILFTIVGYLISQGLTANWPVYLKYLGTVGVIALIVGIFARGGDSKKHSH